MPHQLTRQDRINACVDDILPGKTFVSADVAKLTKSTVKDVCMVIRSRADLQNTGHSKNHGPIIWVKVSV